ncbi:MAG: SDR family NAD(P)-dependent oxidoreductase [Pseudomonadota bacterium]
MAKKVALISGCSSGIGKDIAIELAKHDWRVLAGVRKQEDGDVLSNEYPNITPIILDVTNPQHIQDCAELLNSQALQVDALINNAGIAFGGPIEVTSIQEWREVFDVNVFGLVELTTAVLPFIRRAKGRIINISSISGLVASPFMSVYASSKFAIEAFSDSLRRETKALGIHVSVIEPGPIKTKIWDKGVDGSMQKLDNLTDELRETYGDAGTTFKSIIDGAIAAALPVSATTRAIYKACISDKPRSRYIISKNKRAIQLLRLLPDSWADKLILSIR